MGTPTEARTPPGAEDDLGGHRNYVVHLVESAKLAVQAAIYAGEQIAAKLDKHGVGT